MLRHCRRCHIVDGLGLRLAGLTQWKYVDRYMPGRQDIQRRHRLAALCRRRARIHCLRPETTTLAPSARGLCRFSFMHTHIKSRSSPCVNQSVSQDDVTVRSLHAGSRGREILDIFSGARCSPLIMVHTATRDSAPSLGDEHTLTEPAACTPLSWPIVNTRQRTWLALEQQPCRLSPTASGWIRCHSSQRGRRAQTAAAAAMGWRVLP